MTKENFRLIKRFPPKGGALRNTMIESHGPEGKVRGTLHQLAERYVTLGRDALREGDAIIAEGFFQHAEHYRRLLAAAPAPRRIETEQSLAEEEPEMEIEEDKDGEVSLAS